METIDRFTKQLCVIKSQSIVPRTFVLNYQARIDGKGLQSGEKDFTRLPNLYVLTVTDFDPFGEDQMVYTVHNMCEEVPELKYEDGLRFYYFYTDGQKGGNEALRAVLRYRRTAARRTRWMRRRGNCTDTWRR